MMRFKVDLQATFLCRLLTLTTRLERIGHEFQGKKCRVFVNQTCRRLLCGTSQSYVSLFLLFLS